MSATVTARYPFSDPSSARALMIRARWCWAMNSRESGCRPGSGRGVEFEATNEKVPQADRPIALHRDRIPFRYLRHTERFLNRFRPSEDFDDFDRKASAHPSGDARSSWHTWIRAGHGPGRDHNGRGPPPNLLRL